MGPDEIAECSSFLSRALRRRLAAIDPALYVERPLLGVAPAEKRLVDVFPLASNLGAPEPDLSRVKVAISCALCVH